MSPSTHYRSFRRRVFPVKSITCTGTDNLTRTTKRQNTQITQRKKWHWLTAQQTHSKYLGYGQREPGLVALYDIRPGNGAGLFLQPWSLNRAQVRGASVH